MGDRTCYRGGGGTIWPRCVVVLRDVELSMGCAIGFTVDAPSSAAFRSASKLSTSSLEGSRPWQGLGFLVPQPLS